MTMKICWRLVVTFFFSWFGQLFLSSIFLPSPENSNIIFCISRIMYNNDIVMLREIVAAYAWHMINQNERSLSLLWHGDYSTHWLVMWGKLTPLCKPLLVLFSVFFQQKAFLSDKSHSTYINMFFAQETNVKYRNS